MLERLSELIADRAPPRVIINVLDFLETPVTAASVRVVEFDMRQLAKHLPTPLERLRFENAFAQAMPVPDATVLLNRPTPGGFAPLHTGAARIGRLEHVGRSLSADAAAQAAWQGVFLSSCSLACSDFGHSPPIGRATSTSC